MPHDYSTRFPNTRPGFLRVFLLYFHGFFTGYRASALPSTSVITSALAVNYNPPSVYLTGSPFPRPRTTPRRSRAGHTSASLKRDRLFSDIFLRFLESLLGGRVLFIFVRNMWFSLSLAVFIQEHIFARRIVQYASRALRHQRGAW